jgi:hypothetical protein
MKPRYLFWVCFNIIRHVFAWSTTGLTEDVAWDSKSLFIHGQRVFILSAEVHPWRIIPGADARYWRDVFEKIAANGFNTVSFYTSWATHYPTRDSEGDFAEGTYRDIQLFIDEAKKAGLWLIARPGTPISLLKQKDLSPEVFRSIYQCRDDRRWISWMGWNNSWILTNQQRGIYQK